MKKEYEYYRQEQQNQAAGCIVRKEDSPFVIASVVCCLIFVNYGASAASLGPALPALASHYHLPYSQMGLTFTSRAIGYFIGISLSSYVVLLEGGLVTKDMIAAVCQIVCGTCLFLIDKIDNYDICILLFVIQGCFFGLINTITNILLPELWGKRVAPWMQTMHASFGVGAILGPACIGYFGYNFDFFLLSVTSFLPCLTLLLYHLFLSLAHPSSLLIKQRNTAKDTSPKTSRARDTPLTLKLLVSGFFLFYVGAEASYAGWISSYALLEHVTESEADAAYLSSIFWAALTVGRVTAIPLAIFFSSTTLIRIQLFLAVVAGLLCLTILSHSYLAACVVSAVSGYALSSMFPVMLTIVSDYGYRVDAATTSMFMIGATMGEAAVPVVIGLLMGDSRPGMMPVSVCVLIAAMLCLYLAFHCLSHREVEVVPGGGFDYEVVKGKRRRDDYIGDDLELTAFEEVSALNDYDDDEGDDYNDDYEEEEER